MDERAAIQTLEVARLQLLRLQQNRFDLQNQATLARTELFLGAMVSGLPNRESEGRALLEQSSDHWENFIAKSTDPAPGLANQTGPVFSLGVFPNFERDREAVDAWSERARSLLAKLRPYSQYYVPALLNLSDVTRELAVRLMDRGATDQACRLLETDLKSLDSFTGPESSLRSFILVRLETLAGLGKWDGRFDAVHNSALLTKARPDPYLSKCAAMHGEVSWNSIWLGKWALAVGPDQTVARCPDVGRSVRLNVTNGICGRGTRRIDDSRRSLGILHGKRFWSDPAAPR